MQCCGHQTTCIQDQMHTAKKILFSGSVLVTLVIILGYFSGFTSRHVNLVQLLSARERSWDQMIMGRPWEQLTRNSSEADPIAHHVDTEPLIAGLKRKKTGGHVDSAPGTLHGAAGTLHGAAGTLHGAAGTLHGAAGRLHGAAGAQRGTADRTTHSSLHPGHQDPFFYPEFNPNISCTPEPQTCDMNKPLVPNLVHFIWFFENKTAFPFYYLVSALSALRIQEPDAIWFWYNKTLPTGRYWAEWKQEVRRAGEIKFRLIQTSAPTHIYGKKIKFPEHKSDIMRLHILSKHGGIYLDGDMLILRNLKPLMCYNHTQGRATRSAINNAFIMAAPENEYLKIWYDSYSDYNPDYWGGNSVVKPMQLWRKHPDQIHVENMCLIRPNWQGPEIRTLFREGFPFDWSRHYGLHLFTRLYGRKINHTTIRTTNNTLSHILSYIYFDLGEKQQNLV